MPYDYLTINYDDLNQGIASASYFDVNTQKLYEQKILDSQQFFGDNQDDILEISIYDSNQYPLIFNRILPKITYSVLEGSYRDINGDPKTYNIKNPFTNYVINSNDLLLHTQQDLKLNELTPGLYYVLYNPLRYMAGNPDNRLVIKEISPSRTEIRLSFAFNTNANESSRLDAVKISSFAKRNYAFLQIIDEIIPIIDKNTVELTFANNVNSGKNYIKYAQLLGLKTLGQLQEFINNTYIGYDKNVNISSDSTSIIQKSKFIGISEQLKNFVYTNNDVSLSLDEILQSFKVITSKISQDAILQKTTLTNENLTETINMFLEVIYDEWLSPKITELLNNYSNKFYGLYKNALNFDGGNLIKILSHTSYVNNNDKTTNIQLKLDSPLPTNYSIKDTCWISNISLAPIYFKVNLYTSPVSRKVYLNGINFDVEVNTVNPTNDKISGEKTVSLENSKLKLKKKLNDLVINYNEFSNFINFSSAELRTKVAKNKILLYNQLENEKINLSGTANASSLSISSSYIDSIGRRTKEQIDLLETFDEYESYLFFNTSSINSKIESGIEYDESNYNSLVYQLPEYIKNNSDYGDYLKFTSMVGHAFDNILVYIKKFPKIYPIDYNDNDFYPKNYIDELLNSFNWNSTNLKFDKSNLTQLYFNTQEFTGSLSSSYFDYAKSIFNRIINNLGYIYKTKGSSTSFDLMQNIFGIPRGMIDITEYTTPSILSNRDIFYDFDDIIYATKFENSQFINFNFTSSDYTINKTSEWTFGSSSISIQNITRSYVENFSGISTIETSFRSDQYKRYGFRDKIDIIKKYRNNQVDWKIYLEKTKQKESAKLIFEFSPPETSYTTKISSDELPFFNGDFYTFMIKREPDPNIIFDKLEMISQSVSLTQSFISYANDKYNPFIYTLNINQYYGGQLNFSDKKTTTINYDKNKYFSSGSYYVGNYSSSYQFHGNIDKIKVQKYVLKDLDFNEHSYNINSISIPNKEKIYENLYYLWSFDTPVNLYSGSGMSMVNNQNNFYLNKFYAYNFGQVTVDRGYPYCDTISTDKFPYQFEKFEIKQAVNSNTYGPNYRSNSNINKITEIVDTNLVPYEYSSYTNDVFGSDSNLVGYYISPYKFLNSKIEDFLGKEGINKIIGNPKYITSREYPELKVLQNQFSSNNLKYIYPQEFYTTYRFYIDFSIFDFVKKLSPSRSSLKSGLLLEPSIFDRRKFNYKDVSFNAENSNDTVYSLNYNINAKFTQSLVNTNNTSSFAIINYTNINDKNKDNDTRNFYYMEIPDKIDNRDFIFSKYGIYINVNSDGYTIRKTVEFPKNEHYLVHDELDPSLVTSFTCSFDEIQTIGSGSGLLLNQTTNDNFLNTYRGSFNSGYSDRHLSKFKRVGTRSSVRAISINRSYIVNGVKTEIRPTVNYQTYTKGENNSSTTINRDGLLNGSSPIITIPGFLQLDIESDNFDKYGILTGSAQYPNSLFIQLPLTCSTCNSASLPQLIMNL